MNLWDLEENQSATVFQFQDGLQAKQKLRLHELGLQPGAVIICLKHIPFSGPRVYQVGGTVFSIAYDIASGVEVRKVA